MGKLSNRRRWRENAFDTRKAARTTLTIKRFPVLTAYMNSLCERTEAIRGKAVNRRVDNMLKVSTDRRKAALDLRLVGKEQPAGESSKICQCVERVTALYNKYPQMTQLIFCDYATPKKDAFNVYDALKEKLVRCGIPDCADRIYPSLPYRKPQTGAIS